MTYSSTAYIYRERRVFDLKTLIQALRFISINIILAFIFLFLTLEEFEWEIFSHRKKITDEVIDNTSWNIKILI